MKGRGLDTSGGSWRQALLSGLLALAGCLALLVPGLLRPLDLMVFDAALRFLPERPARHVVAVLVDESAIRRVGPWPWPRATLAAVVDGLREAGAAGVVVDLLLPEPREGDVLLGEALSRLPSALGAGLDDRGGWLLPSRALRAGTQLAHVSFEPDGDGVVRSFLSTRQSDELSLPALALSGSRLLDPSRPIPVGAHLRPAFRSAGSRLPRVSAADVLDRQPAALELVRGRLAFLGASAAGIGDRVVSPASPGGVPEPGVLVQAASAESVASNDLLHPVPTLFLAFLAGLLALLAERLRGGGLRGSRSGAVGLSLLPLVAALLLPAGGLLLPAAAPTVAALSVLLARELVAVRGARRRTAEAEARVADLEALAREVGEARREEAESRRMVAHELKTPLTSVRGLAQLLSRYDLSGAERRRVASLVADETARLSTMVESLLDLERLKLQDFHERAAPVDLSRLAAERVAVHRGSGRTVALESEPGVLVLGDASLLSRLVDNLVGNALKFSPEGSPVRVSIRGVGRQAVLEVADRGPGVPEEERAAIFRRFARGSASAAAPGLGLGLALVAEVAAWHGGCVEVAGQDRGALFRVSLPLASAGG